MGSGTGTPTFYAPTYDFSRPYTSVLDVLDDLEIDGVKSHTKLYRFILAASQLIDKRGHFVPLYETRTMDGSGHLTQWISPLLAIDSLTLDGTLLAAADYVLRPPARMWEHGPYTSIELTSRTEWTASEHNQVVIAGQWGLYGDTIDLGLTVTQASDAATLVFERAADLSPGVIVELGSEHEVIHGYSDPVAVASLTITADLDDADPVLTLSLSEAVTRGEILRLGFEQMRVLDVNGASVLVLRGWNATTRAAHSAGAAVSVYRAFTVQRGVNGTTAAVHTSVAARRVLPPYDVRYLCEQIAALMYKKGQGGFAGKTGNAELGEVFYHNEFPDDPIKKVLTGYRIVTI